jgi:hypothetical protein
MRRWGFGAAAAVVGVVAIVGVLLVLALRQEFRGPQTAGESPAVTNGAVTPTSAVDPKSASGTVRRAAPPPTLHAPQWPILPARARRRVLAGRPLPRGAARQPADRLRLALNPDSTFQVQATPASTTCR